MDTDKTGLVLTVRSGVAAPEWDAQARALGGCCFHSHCWGRFSAGSNGAHSLYLAWHDRSGEWVGLALATPRTLRAGKVPLGKSLRIGSLPAAAAGISLMDLVRSLIAYANREGFASLHIGSFGTPVDLPELEALGFTTSRRWEFLLPLDGTEDELWSRLHVKKRNLIRKGMKAGIRIEEAGSEEDLAAFREIAEETYRRKRSRGVAFPRPAPESYWRRLKTCVIDGGLGRLSLAWARERPVAGAATLLFGGSAYYLLSAANEEGLASAAPDLLLWTAIGRYREAGCRLFNFGGVSEPELNGKPLEESGLYHFKMRFSPELHACRRGELKLKPGVIRLAEWMRRVRGFAQ